MQNTEEIRKFICAQKEITVPDLQKRFSLSYAAARAVVDESVQSGTIAYAEGIVYRVLQEKDKPPVYMPRTPQEASYIKALWVCVACKRGSTSLLQRRMRIGYAAAARAIDWMEENGYISPFPERKPLLTEAQFVAKFGDSYAESNDSSPDMQVTTIDDDDAVGLNLEDFLDDDDEDDDEDDTCDFGDYDDEDDDEDESDEPAAPDVKALLAQCLSDGVSDGEEPNTYLLKADESLTFDMRFVQDGKALRLSDMGKTLPQLTVGIRKIRNVLKAYAPVSLEGKEICITTDDSTRTLSAMLALFTAIDALKRS